MSTDDRNPRKGTEPDAPTAVDERREQIVRGRIEPLADDLRKIQTRRVDNIHEELDHVITDLKALRAMLPEGDHQ